MRRRSRRLCGRRSCHRASEDRALECPADRYRHPLLRRSGGRLRPLRSAASLHRDAAVQPRAAVGDRTRPRRSAAGQDDRDIAAGADLSGITRKARAMHFFANRQEEAPTSGSRSTASACRASNTSSGSTSAVPSACSTPTSRWSPICVPTKPAYTCRASPNCSKPPRSSTRPPRSSGARRGPGRTDRA